MEKIPQKGWFIYKEEGDGLANHGTRIYHDGKLLGGVQKASIEIDAKKMVPILKLEIIAWEGMTWHTVFSELSHQLESLPEPKVFRSTSTPEEILKILDEKQNEAKTPDTEAI